VSAVRTGVGGTTRPIEAGDPVVRVSNVTKSFDIPGTWPWSPKRRVDAVRGVDLVLRRGEVVALVGQSGSGKTTLSRMILGLERPSSGEIHIESHRWDTMAEGERQRLRVAYQYVPQDALSALDPQQTVLEHVVETLTVLGKSSGNAATEAAKAMLARLGLGHRHGALPRELSGGEQRRVTLARVLALDPRLVVADEPTSGLDPDRRAQPFKATQMQINRPVANDAAARQGNGGLSQSCDERTEDANRSPHLADQIIRSFRGSQRLGIHRDRSARAIHRRSHGSQNAEHVVRVAHIWNAPDDALFLGQQGSRQDWQR
jgi:ABC-type dipeptide/oligopeptide/nickel transport system ATPase subunit